MIPHRVIENWRDFATHAFTTITIAVLCLTAYAKIWASGGDSQALTVRDPLLKHDMGTLLLVSAGFELSTVAVCLISAVKQRLFLIAWLSTSFVSYRIGLWWIGWRKPCSCLGNLTDALHISPQLADNVMKGLLAFMFIGSVSLLIAHHRQGRPLDSSAPRPVPEPEKA